MIAVHPGRQVSPLATPEFAEAAAVSLAARPEGGAGWSKAWKASIWARRHKADKAYHELNLLITEGKQHGESAETSNDLDAHQGGIQANLLNTHPPFQIDGNFGYASAVGEMLLQSHLGYLHFLPAAPEAWAKGSIHGLKARGGFEIDFTWRDGALAEGVIRSDLGQPCRIYSKEPLAALSDSQEVATKRDGDVVSFATEPGATYEIRYERK
jgi:alpha-L-fucosidase 2